MKEKFNKKREAQSILSFLLKELHPLSSIATIQSTVDQNLGEENKLQVRNAKFSLKFLIYFILASDPRSSERERKKPLLKTKRFPKRFRSREKAENKHRLFKNNWKCKLGIDFKYLRQWEEEEMKLIKMMKKGGQRIAKICQKKTISTT